MVTQKWMRTCENTEVYKKFITEEKGFFILAYLLKQTFFRVMSSFPFISTLKIPNTQFFFIINCFALMLMCS